ncbi:ATP-grasp domain-containing protein [Streptomyces europaeiscabiei]|uniref:ATP-grasp domain-containing protein n=1 Tax=Streptomyces europaeiscabiei TaxID=146819 RepID=UPI0029BCA30A|nr:ATP-grasp domain-containing protein [Streptomyces europaeiscabiei]MDX2525291.1 ATP-grasp domain-containing protein [Streptomyces europaeiscabiei]
MSESIDLIVPNIAEFNLRHPSQRFAPAVEKAFSDWGTGLADQCVFWSARRRVLVLPHGVDRLWLEDVHAALGQAVPPVVSPHPRGGLLLQDLLGDGSALAALRGAVEGHERVRLIVWGATPGVYALAAAVQSWGPDVELEGTDEPHYWASLYLDSKQSCQDLAGYVPAVRVPKTFTVTCDEELEGAVRHLTAIHRQAIVKSMFGVGGNGSAVVGVGRKALERFWSTAHREPFLQTYPLLVQEYVERARDRGCPAVDLFIDDGGVRQIVLSSMTVDGHRFRDVAVGTRSVTPDDGRRIRSVGHAMGTSAHALGFRGWFCVDFLVSSAGELYVTEINARRSGAAHSIALLGLLGSPDELVAHSYDTLPVALPAPVSYADGIRPVFQRLWAEGIRAYPTTVRGLTRSRPSIGLVTIGASVQQANEVAAEVQAALSEQGLGSRGLVTANE